MPEHQHSQRDLGPPALKEKIKSSKCVSILSKQTTPRSQMERKSRTYGGAPGASPELFPGLPGLSRTVSPLNPLGSLCRPLSHRGQGAGRLPLAGSLRPTHPRPPEPFTCKDLRHEPGRTICTHGRPKRWGPMPRTPCSPLVAPMWSSERMARGKRPGSHPPDTAGF